MKYLKEDLLKMHEHMVRGRLFSIKIQQSIAGGSVRISFHSPIGQEAAGVGIISGMRDTDWFCATHRSQNSTMMRFDLYRYVCEFFCKKDGIGGGTTYDYHLSDHDARIVLPVAILGADFPIYTGFAWSLKNQGKDEVVVIEAGDGACSEGATFEAWNMAALYKVPCVFVIVNNGWGMSNPTRVQSYNVNIAEKAVPMGLSIQMVDGNDVLAVREAMEIAVEKARNFEPNVVELKTLRWTEHCYGQREYEREDKEKLEDAKINDDPIKRFEKYLLENNIIDQTYLNTKFTEIDMELNDVFERAKAARDPEFDDVFKKEYIYANVETGGDM